MVMAALGFAIVGVRARETERERVRGACEGTDVRWPLQRSPSHDAAQPQLVHAMRRPWPMAGRPLLLLDRPVSDQLTSCFHTIITPNPW